MHPADPFAHRYTKLRLVGRGGFGVVYRAWDSELERDVALKLLNPELAANNDWRKRFRREATAASKLNHANITIVYDVGEYEGQPFIVMELVEGETLSRLIERRIPLSVPERLLLLEQLCGGLHYAHQRAILHRDIKPGNMVVREDHDGTRTLKILDFGIAKVVNSGQTSTGELMFTPSYVSPEQIRDDQVEQVDGRSDMFAVGAVSYELLVFEKAFAVNAKNPFTLFEEVKRKIVEEPHRPMTDVQPDIDAELVEIVDRALAKFPAERYRDLAEMQRKFRRVRERLAETLAASSPTTTVVLSARIQAAMQLARHALAADDPTEAVRHLEGALSSQPSQRERRFIEQSLEDARARQTAKRAERLAHDEEAARAAIAMALAAFRDGEETAALRALEAFEPALLVAEQLERFRKAAADIATADRAVAEGAPAERAAALLALERVTPDELIGPALQRLRATSEARRQIEDGDRATAAIDRATAAVLNGPHEARERALSELADFRPTDLVAPALQELRTRATARDEADRAAETEAAERTAQAAEAESNAGHIADARTSIVEAQRLPPDNPDLDTLQDRVPVQRPAIRQRWIRHAPVRVAAAVAAVSVLVAAYGFWPWTKVVPPTAQSGQDQETRQAGIPTPVTIDAMPWARFKITSQAKDSKEQPRTGETPVRLELLPGEYAIELENGGVTPPSTKTLVVAAAPFSIVYTMPGFEPDRAVSKLLNPVR